MDQSEMLQAFIDKKMEEWQKDRASEQMTLGQMIVKLKTLPQDAKVRMLGHLHSYRGYYEDLAFERDINEETEVSKLLQHCQSAMGRRFTGWKGGEFLMGEDTPLWISEVGEADGMRLLDLEEFDDGVYIPVYEEEEW